MIGSERDCVRERNIQHSESIDTRLGVDEGADQDICRLTLDYDCWRVDLQFESRQSSFDLDPTDYPLLEGFFWVQLLLRESTKPLTARAVFSEGGYEIGNPDMSEAIAEFGYASEPSGSSKSLGFQVSPTPIPKIEPSALLLTKRKLAEFRRAREQAAMEAREIDVAYFEQQIEALSGWLRRNTGKHGIRRIPSSMDYETERIGRKVRRFLNLITKHDPFAARYLSENVLSPSRCRKELPDIPAGWLYAGDYEWECVNRVSIECRVSDSAEDSARVRLEAPNRWHIQHSRFGNATVKATKGMTYLFVLLKYAGVPLPAASIRAADEGFFDPPRSPLPEEESVTEKDDHLGSYTHIDIPPGYVVGRLTLMHVLKALKLGNNEFLAHLDIDELAKGTEAVVQVRSFLIAEAQSEKQAAVCAKVRKQNEEGYRNHLRKSIAAERAANAVELVAEKLREFIASNEKARSTVTHGINAAIAAIREQNPELGDYFSREVETGSELIFHNDSNTEWDVGDGLIGDFHKPRKNERL